jgi:hypothetical protein
MQQYYLTQNKAYLSSAVSTADTNLFVIAKRTDGTYIDGDAAFATAKVKFTYKDSSFVLSTSFVKVNNSFIAVTFTPTMTGPITAEIVDGVSGLPLANSISTKFYCTSNGAEPASLESGTAYKFFI